MYHLIKFKCWDETMLMYFVYILPLKVINELDNKLNIHFLISWVIQIFYNTKLLHNNDSVKFVENVHCTKNEM